MYILWTVNRVVSAWGDECWEGSRKCWCGELREGLAEKVVLGGLQGRRGIADRIAHAKALRQECGREQGAEQLGWGAVRSKAGEGSVCRQQRLGLAL